MAAFRGHCLGHTLELSCPQGGVIVVWGWHPTVAAWAHEELPATPVGWQKLRLLQPGAEWGPALWHPSPAPLQAATPCRCGALSSPPGTRSLTTASTAWRTAGSTSLHGSPSPTCTISWTTTQVRAASPGARCHLPGPCGEAGGQWHLPVGLMCRNGGPALMPLAPAQSVGRGCAVPSGSPAPWRMRG